MINPVSINIVRIMLKIDIINTGLNIFLGLLEKNATEMGINIAAVYIVQARTMLFTMLPEIRARIRARNEITRALSA